MSVSPNKPNASDSSEQRKAEQEILAALSRKLRVRLDGKPGIAQRVELDGFRDGRKPVCVEVFAHQGPSKDGQRKKLMRDMCKLLLVEKLIGRACRKIVVVCDPEALRFLSTSWQGQFAEEFGIERIAVEVPSSTREALRQAQKRQYR